MAFTPHSLRRQAEQETLTLPALKMEAHKIALSLLHGDFAMRKKGMGDEFWQYKPYSESDRPQDIDWRQTAKSDSVFIRLKEQHSLQTTLFWCDTTRDMDYKSAPKRPTKGEAAKIISLAAGIALAGIDTAIGPVHTRQTSRHNPGIDILANYLMNEPHNPLLPQLHHYPVPKNASLILAGDFLSPLPQTEEVLHHFHGLAERIILIQVLDPAELTLPFSGHLIFQNPQNTTGIEIDNASAIRTQYIDRINAHCAGLEGLCKKYGCAYIRHQTDRPLHDGLMQLCQGLMGAPGSQPYGGRV